MTPLLTPPLINRVHHMEALTLMRLIPAGTVDAVITDLPYGTTSCSWDQIIPFAPMWAEVKRVLKQRGVFVTTASQPFTSALVMSNPSWFRYEWIWEKSVATNFANANKQPLRTHENVLIFAREQNVFIPQFDRGTPYVSVRGAAAKFMGKTSTNAGWVTLNTGTRHPRTILRFDNQTGLHPTQKPVALYKYLVRTYTQPNDLILDFCCGSGTTLVAAQELGRQFIGGDLSEQYCEVARKRLAMPFTKPMFA